MAEYLSKIFGTEYDKVNCTFYLKVGACRHGDRCSRHHNKPSFSQTVLLKNLYQNPHLLLKSVDGSSSYSNVTDDKTQEHYENFYEDVFIECEDKYGQIEEMHVSDNPVDHLVGNVYIKFIREKDAEAAVKDLNNRWFGGRPINAELSPVTYFRNASCNQYQTGGCSRASSCNFLHMKPISRYLRTYLFGSRTVSVLTQDKIGIKEIKSSSIRRGYDNGTSGGGSSGGKNSGGRSSGGKGSNDGSKNRRQDRR